MLIYETREWKGFGKQNYYWNEYRLEGDTVYKYKCNRHKFFDGHENEWVETKNIVQSWDKNDESMPDWLKERI